MNIPTEPKVIEMPPLAPRPVYGATHCDLCGSNALSKLQLCTSGELKNLGRWFQKCLNHNAAHLQGGTCPGYVWHGAETDVRCLSEELQTYLAYRQSLADLDSATPIPCAAPDCLPTSSNTRRCANRLCQRFPICCSQCCRARGGCKAHKILGLSTGSSSSTPYGVNNSQPPATQALQSVAPLPYSQPPATQASQSLAPLPLTQFRAAQPAVVPASQSFAPLPPAQFRATYARPLDENYGRAYQRAQAQREEQAEALLLKQKALTESNNTIPVIFWNEKHKGPTKCNLLTRQAGFFYPMHHDFLMNSMGHPQYVSFFATHPTVEWVIQDVGIPISVKIGSRILICSINLSEDDCPFLDTEMQHLLDQSRLLSHAPRSTHTVSSLARSATALPPAPAVSTSTNGTTASNLTAISTATHYAPLAYAKPSKVESSLRLQIESSFRLPPPFPLTYVCDMVKGLESLMTLKGDHSVRTAFEKAFPRCAFVRSSVNRARNLLWRAIEAKEMGLIRKYVARGRTEGGKWQKFRAEINRIHPSAKKKLQITEDMLTDAEELFHGGYLSLSDAGTSSGSELEASSPPLQSQHKATDVEDGPLERNKRAIARRAFLSPTFPDPVPDVDDYEIVSGVYFEDYAIINGRMTSMASGAAREKTLEGVIRPHPLTKGRSKEIHLLVCKSVDGDSDSSHVLKKFYNPSAWFEFPSRGLWCEGAKMAKCHFYSNSFKERAAREGVALPADFEVLPTSIFRSSHPAWSEVVSQPESRGIVFSMGSLTVEAHLDTLHAFSHFTYDFSERHEVMVEFQGHIGLLQRLTVFDCTLHSVGVIQDDPDTGFPTSDKETHVGDRDSRGIDDFCRLHTCSELCRRLGLSRLPQSSHCNDWLKADA